MLEKLTISIGAKLLELQMEHTTKIITKKIAEKLRELAINKLENPPELEQSILKSNSLEILFSKISSFLERTAPDIWQNNSFYFYDIVEDHRENLIPHYRKHGYEWIATCITCWRLLCFFKYCSSKLLRVVLARRRS